MTDERREGKTKANFLIAEGWIRVSRKRMGMIIIERWGKPGTDCWGYSQGHAYQVARDSKKWREAKRKEKPNGR